jgi:hypothetical protein
MSWEQVGNSVKFFAFFVASKVGKAGLLDVTVDVYNPAGAQIVIDGSAVEVGGGLYSYVLAFGSVTTEGEYTAIFKTADGDVDAQHLPSLWIVGRAGVENLDASIAARTAGLIQRSEPPTVGAVADQVWDELLLGHAGAGSAGATLSTAGAAADPLLNVVPGAYAAGTAGYALGKIGTGQVSVVQAVSADGAMLVLVRGDDYATEVGRSIVFSSSDWPDLTAATVIRMSVRRSARVALGGLQDDALLFSHDDTALSRVVGAAPQSITFDLPASKTARLNPGLRSGKFDVQATIDGKIVTLIAGNVTVVEDQTR